MVSIEEILDRREMRAAQQVRLLRDTRCPVISATAVTPGANKNDATAAMVCAAASQAVDALLNAQKWICQARIEVNDATGPEFLMAVDAPPEQLKGALTQLEDQHPLGRLWDLDVVTGPDDDGIPVVVGRNVLNQPPRRCLVCDGDAASCARNAAHPLSLVMIFRQALAVGLNMHTAAKAADLASESLRVEARLTPKPGLVDQLSTGSHSDMDLPLFERSAEALNPWFRACWLIGALYPGDLQPILDLGITAAADMLRFTGGVNTHKGALFSLGLALAAMGSDAARTADLSQPTGLVDRIAAQVAELTEPLLADWIATAQPDSSHGAAALCSPLKMTGARGEAASGFSTVRTIGMPAYRIRLAKFSDEADALRWTLVCLMAKNPDTNLVSRGGESGLRFVQRWASRVMAVHPGPQALQLYLQAAEPAFITRRLSPGGSADLLALTWFFAHLP